MIKLVLLNVFQSLTRKIHRMISLFYYKNYRTMPFKRVELICDVLLGYFYIAWIGDCVFADQLPLYTPHHQTLDRNIDRLTKVGVDLSMLKDAVQVPGFTGSIDSVYPTIDKQSLQSFSERIASLRDCVGIVNEKMNTTHQRYSIHTLYNVLYFLHLCQNHIDLMHNQMSLTNNKIVKSVLHANGNTCQAI